MVKINCQELINIVSSTVLLSKKPPLIVMVKKWLISGGFFFHPAPYGCSLTYHQLC